MEPGDQVKKRWRSTIYQCATLKKKKTLKSLKDILSVGCAKGSGLLFPIAKSALV
jgi:hypothetical protein